MRGGTLGGFGSAWFGGGGLGLEEVTDFFKEGEFGVGGLFGFFG